MKKMVKEPAFLLRDFQWDTMMGDDAFPG